MDNVGTKTMSESDKVFIGSIPKIYDDYLVPLIFQGFAQDLAQRAANLSPTASRQPPVVVWSRARLRPGFLRLATMW